MMMKPASTLCFVTIVSISTVACSDPWGWQTPSITGAPHHVNEYGQDDSHGHEDSNVYDKVHIDKFDHENAHHNGETSGFAKGAKTDWANYQYGGEGSRAEGDQFERSYGSSFGNGHDSGHASGDHYDHGQAGGQDYKKSDGWGNAPYYSSENIHHKNSYRPE